jgi:tRNA pseudouridine55 synthase
VTLMVDQPKAPETQIAGLVNLYKPVGPSSARYVYRLRQVFGIRKVGHAGTLDPFADGVLIGCVGRATKLVESLMELPKQYRTTLRLGVTNDTFDTERPFVDVTGAVPVSREQIEAVLTGMVGDVEQVPPAYSAIRMNGVLSYKRAKRGDLSPRTARTIRIDAINIEHYEWPLLTLGIHCGRGTYIRAIARDVGDALRCGACCQSLTRTAVGQFTIENSVNLLTATPDQVRGALALPVEP